MPANPPQTGGSAEPTNILPPTPPPSLAPPSFKIIAGSYEKLLYGLEASLISSTHGPELAFHLNPIFIFSAHVSCIKAVAASPEGGKWLATGSTDEVIKVWDLRRRKEVGGLMHHEGSSLNLPPSSCELNSLDCQGRSHTSSFLLAHTFCRLRKMERCVCSEPGIGLFSAFSRVTRAASTASPSIPLEKSQSALERTALCECGT
jgi:hypothetical protein